MRGEGTVRGLVPSDLRYFRWLEEIVVSPSGERVAYTVRRVDVERDGYVVDVFLRELDGDGEARRLTGGDGEASSLAWSADGERLAYVWSGDEGRAICVLRMDGKGAAYAVEGKAPSSLSWSPDGEQLACVRWTKVERGDEPVYGEPWPVEPSMRVIRRRVYKLNGVGFIEDQYKHVWILALGSGGWTQVTGGENDYGEPRWSRDGERIVMVRMEREINTAIGAGELVIWHVEDGRLERPLREWSGIGQSPRWGEDDQVLVFTGHEAPEMANWRAYSTVYRYEIGEGRPVDLLPEVNEAVGNYAVADQRKALTNITVKWPERSEEVTFLLTELGAVNLYSMSAKGGERRKLAGEQSVVFEYDAGGGRIVYGEANPGNPGDLWLLEGGERKRLTNLNPWLRFRKLSRPEAYWYRGLEGADVHAWMMRPTGFGQEKQYPLVLQVHCSMFSWDFHFENQILAEAGYAVGYSNQRGTTAGYGEAWTKEILGNSDDVDFQEIMMGVDDLLERYPFVDGDRMGVAGGSCGGLLTNWIVGHTDRFQAAVTQRSISNSVSRIGSSDTGPLHVLSEHHTHPWEDLETTWNVSPIKYAPQVKTPLLIIHSDEDHRCPIEQAEEFFTVLRWMGKEVEFCWFQGESHGLSRGGRPGNRAERLRRIVGWFEQYLGR